MTVTVNDFLAGYGVGDSFKHEKVEDLNDLMGKMSPDQKDFIALIVGAALDGGGLDEGSVDRYIELSDMDKYLIDFIVGNVEAEELAHSIMERVGAFLEHYGVKGMKWGVIRDRINPPSSLSRSSENTSVNRKAARAAVESGGGVTAKQAGLAALKSKGHRAINALTGDKTFWRRMAYTSGIAVGVAAPPIAAAWLLPAGTLAALGSSSVGVAMAGSYASSAFATPTATAMGSIALANAGLVAGYTVNSVGGLINIAGNTARAVAGNTIVNRNYAKVGNTLLSRQKSGRKRVLGALNAVAGTRVKDLRHSDISFDEIFHALEAGSGGGKGKRKFDESKVKRDRDGQFSSKAGVSAKRPVDDGRTPEQMDAEWKKNIDYNKKLNKVLNESGLVDRIINKLGEIEKKYPAAKNYKGPLKSAPPEVVKAVNELVPYMVRETNKVLARTPESISPSGTQRLSYRIVNAGTGLVDMKPYWVDVVKHDGMTAESFIHAMSEGFDGSEGFGGYYKILEYFKRISSGSISHALEAGSGGGKDKRKFDESKVKRDGDGQFSSKAGVNAKRPDPVIRSDDEIAATKDKNWVSDIALGHYPKQLEKDVWTKKVKSDLAAKQAEIEKRTGIKLESSNNTPKAVAARNEYVREAVRQINSRLSVSSAAISPSGTKRLQVSYVMVDGRARIDYSLVPISAKHDGLGSPNLTHALQSSMSLEDFLDMLNKLTNEN